MTQRDRATIQAYENSNNYDLYDVYETFSRAKAEAWERCKRIYNSYAVADGRFDIAYREPLKILGANCFVFSAGFRVVTTNNETFFVYITRDNTREIMEG